MPRSFKNWHSLSSPAAMAPPDVTGPDEKVRPLATARFETPWQDRKTLQLSAPRGRVPASRRLAHGFRGSPKIMKDKAHVR
jgi:hypothetical protein